MASGAARNRISACAAAGCFAPVAMPADLQQTTLYAAGVTASARQADAARALIGVLTAPSAVPVWKAKGLDPAW